MIGLYREAYYVDERRPQSVNDPAYPAWKLEYDAVRKHLEALVLKNRGGATGFAKCHVEIGASAIRNEDDAAMLRRFAA